MGSSHRDGSVRKTVNRKKSKSFEPQVYIDREADFASIKLTRGVEARSYIKDGFVFCEDKHGRVIEVQVLNLSELAKHTKKAA